MVSNYRYVFSNQQQDRSDGRRMRKYKSGFTVSGKQPYETEEWLYSEERSTKDKIVFLGYDANLFPMPDLSSRPNTNYNKARFARLKQTALNLTKDFTGDVRCSHG